ncbi:WD repeat domain 62 isoform X2 [Lycorma delicatula]|uniref:WD repeat domain 62 isoform X2 n=1 Tax=Lycorma delicatula TaxID=130591 RepID=UPI003F516979
MADINHGIRNQKVIRAPSLKRGRNEEVPLCERVKLERVLGLTVSTNAGLDCDPNSQIIAYPAGCTVVLFSILKSRQYHLLNTSRKTVTCVTFSPDGHYLATGECGHVPSVRVWDLSDNSLVSEFPGHKYGINCVAFSPSQKYVVSVGSQHDMIVNVWDWRSGVKVASNKVSTKVKAVAFADNGNYFVTVGNRHVKFWYLEYSRSAKYKEPVPLMGRSAILGEQRNNDFCDVACGKGEMGDSTYAITKSGLLCEFNNRRLLDKWVELRTTSANCMAVGEHHIFIGCAEGIVRCFNPVTLQFITTLPRTHYLGVDVAQGLTISHPNNAKYPDAIALAFDERNYKLSCIYNDHSLYVWDVRDIKRVGKSYSFLYHSACIWAVEMYPTPGFWGVEDPAMPPGSFLTCSSDDTIRVWNLDNSDDSDNKTIYRRNIYSNELLKVMYIDPELNYLKDTDLSGAEKGDNLSYDGRNGVRSIRVSPDGKHLASGDRAGNIRIHDLATLEQLCLIEAHDAEVLCLEYSQSRGLQEPVQDSHNFLASASRDRLIHVFDVDQDYNFVQTLDDHSSSITAVRFLHSHNQLQMISCGADKSIIFRQLQGGQFSRGHNAAGKTTLYDMEVDCMQKHILTACQDRNIRVYSINSGKHTKTFKGSVGEDGSLIKVSLDPSGILVASSCTDKTLCIYDYYSGECLATMLGHSELATGLRFTNDCRRLISASGDGCIFVWKVPHDLVVTMHARLSQQAARIGKKLNGLGIAVDTGHFGPPPMEMLDPNANALSNDNDYRFSVGQLPLWAKKQMQQTVPVGGVGGPRTVEVPKGRWAQRIDPTGITVKSVYDSDSIIPFPMNTEKRLDSDGSKEDSSIDSGTETSRSLFPEIRRETIIVPKKTNRSQHEFLTCPDSLQELINGETTKQVFGGKVTMTRGSDISELHHLQRNRHHTDDSSLGSFKYEDVESTEHDGDVEDYSEGDSTEPEPRQRLIYYPAHEDTNSDYTVNAMDVEELRRSQRSSKHLTVGETSQSQSVSGSQESEEDETVSTPTGEHNIGVAASLSASSETLDLFSHREKFLKNTFESLSGPEMDKEPISNSGKRSISSQHLGSGPRNSNVIMAARHAKNDAETTKKREELQRRIEETRRKLQSVGYRSNLKSSQSIQDLSPRGGSYHDSAHGGKQQQQQQQSSKVHINTSNLVDEDGMTGGIRRACSLSDLANPVPGRQRMLHAGSGQVSGKGVVRSNRTTNRHQLNKQSNTVTRSGTSTMTRSSSVGVLNQSDSESDMNHQQSARNIATMRAMRPTISSQNKISQAAAARRRGISGAYSSLNLSQAVENEDSSSEEGKSGPTPATRARSSSQDRASGGLAPSHRRAAPGLGRSGSERDLRTTPRATKIQRSSSGMVRSVDPVDVSSAPLSQQLITSITEQLMRAADSVIQLHKRLETESQNVDQVEREALLGGLKGAALEAQKKLGFVDPQSNSEGIEQKLQEALTTTSDGSGDVVSMMQQYSDILVSLVQQRMTKESKK